jgi:hypothetical protein
MRRLRGRLGSSGASSRRGSESGNSGRRQVMGKVSKLCVTLSALTTRVQLRIQDEEGRAHRALAYVEVCVWRECLAVSLYRGTPLWLLRSRYCWSNPLPVVHRLSPTSSRKREIRAPG